MNVSKHQLFLIEINYPHLKIKQVFVSIFVLYYRDKKIAKSKPPGQLEWTDKKSYLKHKNQIINF